MPITELQRRRRRAHIGASDSPRICGLSRFGNASDVWAEKVYDLEPDAESEPQWLGNVMEGPLIDWAAAQLNYRVRKNQYRVHPGGVLAANYDALVVDSAKVAIEAKVTGGAFGFGYSADDWGESGSNQVPDDHFVQCQHQIYVCGLDVVWLAAFLPGRGRELFEIRPDVRVIEAMLNCDMAFWHFVRRREQPDRFRPRLETVRRIRREPGSWAVLPEETVGDYLEARQRSLEAGKRLKEAKAALIGALGTCDGGDWGDPKKIVTYYESERRGYTVEPTTTRTLRIAARPEPAGKESADD